MSLQLVEQTPSPEAARMITDEEGAALARAAVNLFRLWSITDAEACILLGGISKRTYARWKEGEIGRLSIDQKTRLSVLMGIHKALRVLFTEKSRVHEWVKKSNRAFRPKKRPVGLRKCGSSSARSITLSTTCAARGNSKTASIRKVTPHRRNWRAGFVAQARMALLTKAFVTRKERLSLRFGQTRSVYRFQDGILRITSTVSGLTSSTMRRVVGFGDSYNLGGLPTY